MSKKKKKEKTKKNHWILKFMLFAVIMFVIAGIAGKVNPKLANVVAILYLVLGFLWFYKNTKVKPD